MGKGRRFSFFWISIFTIAGSGCAGCGDCFGGSNSGCNSGDNSGCNIGDTCDDSYCASIHVQGGSASCGDGLFSAGNSSSCTIQCNRGLGNCTTNNVCDTDIFDDPFNCGSCGNVCSPGSTCSVGSCSFDAGSPGQNQSILDGLVAPSGLASDGANIYYVDQQVLHVLDPFVMSSAVLATGVIASGGIVTDGFYVYWGGQWNPNATSDAGDDGGDASGDDGGPGSILTGIFRANVNTGVVELIAPTTVYPGVALDLNGLGNLYARAQVDADAGTSDLGFVQPDSGAFVSLGPLSGNTGNMHAIAPGALDIAALDNGDIVSFPLDGGSKSLLVGDAGALALLPTSAGQLRLSGTSGSFTLQGVAAGSSQTSVIGSAGEVATFGSYAYVVNQAYGEIDQYSAADLSLSSTAVAILGNPKVSFVAADGNNVYWIAGSSLYEAPVPP